MKLNEKCWAVVGEQNEIVYGGAGLLLKDSKAPVYRAFEFFVDKSRRCVVECVIVTAAEWERMKSERDRMRDALNTARLDLIDAIELVSDPRYVAVTDSRVLAIDAALASPLSASEGEK